MELTTWPTLLAAGALVQALCSPSAPGGLFHVDESVDWSTPPEAEWTIADFDGRPVRAGRAPSTGQVRVRDLPPGWYHMRSAAKAVPFAVLCTPSGWTGRADSPVAIDTASAWREEMRDPSTRAQALRIMRRLGIRWVRDRINWAVTQPEPNRYQFDWYDGIHADLAAQGLCVAQVNHSLPGWASDGRPHSTTPMDLRTVYRFYRDAAARFRTSVQAWEIWNEPDNPGFYRDLSDRYAGVQKAGFLGVRDGNPQALVLSGSFCMNILPFVRHLAEAGADNYFDVLNWHMYAAPDEYADQLAAYRRALGGRQPDTRPAWMTEAGTFLAAGHGADGRQLSGLDERVQARFVAQSYISSLAAGNARHFYFILFDYVENNNQMGLLRADLTPRPSLAVAAAAAWMLDGARYAGRWRGAPAGVTAEMFAGQRPVLALWSRHIQEISVPACPRTRLWNLYGAPLEAAPSGGRIRLSVGPDPVYVTDPHMSITAGRHPAPVVRRTPSRIILTAGANLPIDQTMDCYRLGADGKPPAPFDWVLDLYNLSDKPASGTLHITAPARWKIEAPLRRAMTLLPMDRIRVTVRVTPALPHREDRLSARFSVHGSLPQPAQTISVFRTDHAALPVLRRRTLDWLNETGWTVNTPSDAELKINRTVDGLEFHTVFHKAFWSGNWSYPLRTVAPALFSGMNAFELDIESFVTGGDNHIRLLLAEKSGGQWISGVPAFSGRQRIVLPFRSFTRLTWAGPDQDNRLTLPDVTRLHLGINTIEKEFRIIVREINLVRLPDR